MSKSAPNPVQPASKPAGIAFTISTGVTLPVRPDLVQRHLEKVLLSTEMSRSKKLCQFLRFTVEEVLRGHGSELKEYAIAVSVFRRGRDFDPGADPIVRVQARRLRYKLARYYQNEGRGEPIQIEYPVGGYMPLFVRRPATTDAVEMPVQQGITREGALGRRIAVLPFISVGPEDCEAFSDGLTDELTHALSARWGARVAARSSCFQFKGKWEDARRIGERLGVGALVGGTVRKEGERLRVLVQLIDAETGMNLLSAAYQWELGGILEAQEKISHQASEVLQSYFDSRGNFRRLTAREPNQHGIH